MRYGYGIKFRFYPKEKIDIIIAFLVLTFSFYILISRSNLFHGIISGYDLLTSFLSVLIAFFMHEMAHKYVAFKYGYPAAFKAWKIGLLIAFLSSFFGFLFAAPGAVYVYGYPSKSENGKISAAGPITNLIAGFILFAFLFFLPLNIGKMLYSIAYLNFFLAFFNILPIGPMDGLKVLSWNLPIYIFLLGASVAGVALSYIL
jgi:Zn-dependent protease